MMNKNTILIVSGLPRSGTSLMMQILNAWNIPILNDSHRSPDVHNPKGYFEYAPVKRLAEDHSWLNLARGKAVKIISHLLKYLPDQFQYDILFMNRNLDEVIRSQNKMLDQLGKEKGNLSDEALKVYFARHLEETHRWLAQKSNIRFLDVHYAQLLQNAPTTLQAISHFLGKNYDLRAAQSVIDPQLYRSRS